MKDDDISTTEDIALGQGFKYYSSQRDNIIVNDNGVMYLESSVAIEARRVQPQPVLLQGSEYSLITPYWADTDPTLDGASVSYRSVSREGSGGDEAFGMADDIVRTSYMELQNFETSWLFVVTFDELGFYNPLSVDEMYTHLRNSYQVVLLTDGELSFCIFNYGSLTWTTGWLQDMLDENGNPVFEASDGQEGIYPAQAGFSAGDNSNYYHLEGSNTQEIININRKSNINVPGRFIFRIDGATITEPFIPISALFLPYGPGMGDARIENQNDINTPDILTGQGFKFYGSVRDTLRVNDNGVIFFGQDEPNINASIPLVDVPFIAPFWADVDITSDRGIIYYRNVSRVNSSDSAFERAEASVRTSSMELQNFQSSWMFIVTWESVSYYQDPVDNQYDRLRNSFQTVLLTDGSISLSLFIYGDITWTTGVNQGGNASGLGGNEAQVGFNAGDGVKSHVLDGSYTPDVLNIDNRTNIGIPGIFIFRIDTENIAQSRCKSFGKLSINPSIGSTLGGTEVIIGGACFNSTSIIKCRFDEKVITGIVISPTSAVCVTPTFFKTGRIPLNVSVNNGSTFDFTATFTLGKDWIMYEIVQIKWDKLIPV
ncbi:protein mesh-like [Lytechinus pictus]|uniref:protein mesh-like n=1 Tax=Lytechinus pictus TaxID=7653 RepID=UPI0030B9AF66